jgi:hypothetical protein
MNWVDMVAFEELGGPVFFDDMRALLAAFGSSDRAEVEFRAHEIYRKAKALGRRDVGNAAASVVAAYRQAVGRHGERVAVEWLAAVNGFAVPD